MKNKKDISALIEDFHERSLYIPTRTIYMGSETISEEDFSESGCDALMAERVIKNIHILDSLNQAPINILMDNIGGDEYHCFAIMDAIQTSRSKITITAFGCAMSAGSMILQAADCRIMAASCIQMIHYGTWGGCDHSKTAQKHAKEGLRIDRWMEQLYLERITKNNPTFKLSKLKRMLDHDTYLTAEESVKLGLADKVLRRKQ